MALSLCTKSAGRAIDTGRDDNTTITASGINGIGTETYKFEQYDPTANSGAGAFTTVRSFAAGNTYTFNAPEDANLVCSSVWQVSYNYTCDL